MGYKRKRKDIFYIVEINRTKYLLPYLTSAARLTGVNIRTLRHNITVHGYYRKYDPESRNDLLVEKIALTDI